MSELDEKICKQMESLVELLTTSGKPTLNPEIMKKFKKFCRISDSYVHHAFELLMKQLSVKHAEVRFSAYQMIDELFTRSHMFRELLLADFDTFLELAAGTEKKKPLPAPKAVAENMKNSVNRSILLWVEKFGHAYRKLMLGFEFLKSIKKIDFDGIQATLDLERRQKEETERKLEECRKEKVDKVSTEYAESELEIQLCLTEVENGLQLLMPGPDDFFIPLKDTGGTSMLSHSTSSVTSTVTSSEETITNNDDISVSIHLTDKDMGIENVKNNTHNISGTDISQENNDSEDDNDDFEEVDTDVNSAFTQEHGLFDRKFALTVELGESGRSLKETEDNRDLIQGVRDQYTLIKTKYLPAVKRWIQVMTENSGKEEKVKQLMEVKSKLEDSVKKCVELEIARSKRNRDADSDSDEDDFEDVPEKEGYEEDIPEHVQMEAAMASSSKASKPKKKRAPKKPKIESKSGKKKLGIKNVQQMARDILESQKLLEDDDLDSAVLKSRDVSSKSRCLMDDASLPFLHQSDRQVKHNIKQSSTSHTSVHKPRIETQSAKGSSQKTEKSETQSSATCSQIETQSNNKLDSDNGDNSTDDGKDRKSSLLEKAPFINFGVDLEHWENPDEIKAPAKNRYEGASRFWVAERDVDDQEAGGSEEVASLTRRSFTYVGQFEPVKWKCRAPMSDGKLCERMDRVKCPFHGKIIGRDKEGVPSNPDDVEHMLSGKMKTDLDETTGNSSEGESTLSRSKGKGKGKAKKKKYPNLTEINESKNNCRSRLEAKIFNRSTLRKVNKALDAETLKKLSNKFSHQFNYSLK
ncbi:UV-stimulated scaffold protein A-like isoform X2 [Ruditapes philippinarum]|uniref:UV-stimulated scaffold protein A-like isoform X2 n=1 Tax=Ruditapes philippinarum TaxID=129788 RepID=UPI00295A79CD|nr:UV-stimulated scaffold protein A-like isoform X2 [Ruditapes philippinarum]